MPSKTRLDHLCDGDTFTYRGCKFRVDFQPDYDAEPPWGNDCCRGIVSDWTTRDKRPGEMLLHSYRGHKRYFDFQAVVAKAKEEGWNCEPYKTGTKGERAHRAAMAEYKYLRAWCNNDWCYVGVVVTRVGHGNKDYESDSLWGVETWMDYHQQVARDLAREIVHGMVNARRKARAERVERQYWEARGVETRAA